jgi:hypothetical protein
VVWSARYVFEAEGGGTGGLYGVVGNIFNIGDFYLPLQVLVVFLVI